MFACAAYTLVASSFCLGLYVLRGAGEPTGQGWAAGHRCLSMATGFTVVLHTVILCIAYSYVTAWCPCCAYLTNIVAS